MIRPVLAHKQRARIVIAYKNFGAFKGLSHIGLGVSAMQNCKALIAAGYIAEVWPIISAQDLFNRLTEDRTTGSAAHHIPVTHVMISAPWIKTDDLANLAHTFFDIEFAVVSHSNIGFLQADPRAITLLREGAALEQATTNFHIAGNSEIFTKWWVATYGTPMLTLPNMYPVSNIKAKRWTPGTQLRLGTFCAIRPYKNVLTAAAAALEINARMRPSGMEFHISSGRIEGGAGTLLSSIQELFAGVPRVSLVQDNWASWPAFLATVGSMDLLLQPSYTEGFNMVTADGIAQGVASVVSDAIYWTPPNWMARSDAASDLADKGVSLLHDPNAVQEGIEYLTRHNRRALESWEEFLEIRFQKGMMTHV